MRWRRSERSHTFINPLLSIRVPCCQSLYQSPGDLLSITLSPFSSLLPIPVHVCSKFCDQSDHRNLDPPLAFFAYPYCSLNKVGQLESMPLQTRRAAVHVHAQFPSFAWP